MKLRLTRSEKSKGILSKTTVYDMKAKVELEPKEAAIVERFPSLKKAVICKEYMGESDPVDANLGRLLDGIVICHTENVWELSPAEMVVESGLAKLRSHFDYLVASEQERVIEIQ